MDLSRRWVTCKQVACQIVDHFADTGVLPSELWAPKLSISVTIRFFVTLKKTCVQSVLTDSPWHMYTTPSIRKPTVRTITLPHTVNQFLVQVSCESRDDNTDTTYSPKHHNNQQYHCRNFLSVVYDFKFENGNKQLKNYRESKRIFKYNNMVTS